jgi:hypothetical protein
VHEGRGELNALLVAMRQLLNTRHDTIAQRKPIQPGERSGPALLVRCAVQDREVLELVAEPHLRIQATLLGHVADPLAYPPVDRGAAPRDAAAIRRKQATDDAHRHRLTGTVATDETKQSTGGNREAQAIDGYQALEGPAKSMQLEARAAHALSLRRRDSQAIRDHAQTGPGGTTSLAPTNAASGLLDARAPAPGHPARLCGGRLLQALLSGKPTAHAGVAPLEQQSAPKHQHDADRGEADERCGVVPVASVRRGLGESEAVLGAGWRTGTPLVHRVSAATPLTC